MSKDERKKAVEAVLSDPAALWEILTTKVLIAGPWEAANDPHGPIYEGRWRRSPSNKNMAIIFPSNPVYEPTRGNYTLYDEDHGDDTAMIDEERWDAAVAEAERERRVWKPWTYKVMTKKVIEMYADTAEQAMELADAELRSRGVLLHNGKKPSKKHSLTRARLLLGEEP